MHLAVEAVGNKYGGGATVLVDFLNAALDEKRIERVSVFSSPPALRRFRMPTSPKLRDLPQARPERDALSRIWWYERGLNRACCEIEADVVICMNGMGRTLALPQVNFLQQSLPFSAEASSTLPRLGQFRVATFRMMMGRSCRNAAGVITQIPSMALWAEMAFQLIGTPFEICTPTTSMGAQKAVSNELRRRIERVPRGKRIFYIGNDSPYKQLPVVLQAFGEVQKADDDAVLFLVGPTPPDDVAEGVDYLGFVPYENVASIYRLADLLVLPALVESCSMPLLEAMSLGLPVLAADRPYAHEVSHGAAHYFNPLDADDLALNIEQLLADDDLRQKMKERGRRRYREIQLAQPYQKMIDAVIRWAAK